MWAFWIRNLFPGKQALAKRVTQTVTHLSRYKIRKLIILFPDCIIRGLHKSYTHVLSIRSLAKLEYGIALFRRFLRRKMGDNFAPAGETPAEKTTSSSGQMRAPGTETVVGHNVGDVLYWPFTVTEVVWDLKDHFWFFEKSTQKLETSSSKGG